MRQQIMCVQPFSHIYQNAAYDYAIIRAFAAKRQALVSGGRGGWPRSALEIMKAHIKLLRAGRQPGETIIKNQRKAINIISLHEVVIYAVPIYIEAFT